MAITLSQPDLLGIEPLSRDDISAILDLAAVYARQNRSDQKNCKRLENKLIVNMFFEDSTRTRTSFEIAAKRLGAEVVNFNAKISSINKGETFSDTLRVIASMQVDGICMRHRQNGAPAEAAALLDIPILNAGDGSHEHPTQALLDAMTIQRHKGRLEGLKVAICGDIEHSRVARSNAFLLNKFGANVHFYAPPPFVPKDLCALNVTNCSSMIEALENADVVMMLRVQNERLAEGEFSMTNEDYHRQYGLDHAKLKAALPDVIVMHPAPMNRGVEISNEVADDPRHSVIFEQMEMGVAVRMACLDLLISNRISDRGCQMSKESL